MLFGILGPHATGKSTFCTKLMHWYAEGTLTSAFPLKIILADNGYLLSAKDGKVYSEKLKWTKEKKPEKLPKIEELIADDTTTYLVESARFFGGLAGDIQEMFDSYGGGVYFLLPSVTYEHMLENMRRRCEKKGKTFQEAFWTDRCSYENRDRYYNQLVKQAPRIHFDEVQIDDYGDWDTKALPIIKTVLTNPYESWYK